MLPIELLIKIAHHGDVREFLLNRLLRDKLLIFIRNNYVYDYDLVVRNLDIFDRPYPRIISGLNESINETNFILDNCEILYNVDCLDRGFSISLFSNKIKELFFNKILSPETQYGITPQLHRSIRKNFSLSSNIKKLMIDNIFNNIIIPVNLTHLCLFEYDGVLTQFPKFLTHLNLDDLFNRRIEKDVLPKSLIWFEVGVSFKQSIIDTFHEGIQTIVLGTMYDSVELVHIPKSTELLTINTFYIMNININFNFLTNLQYLNIQTCWTNITGLPINLKTGLFDRRANFNCLLPDTLENLYISCKINISYLKNLKKLVLLSVSDNYLNSYCLPENINYLDISCFSKTQASEINICENVKYMRINNLFSGKFSKNLKTISYANCS